MTTHREIWLDDGSAACERARRFSNPLSVIEANFPEEIEETLLALERARAAGHYLAGYFSYELGYALEPRLRPLLPKERRLPLCWFGVFGPCETFEGDAVTEALKFGVTGRCYASRLRHEWNADEYFKKFSRSQEFIGAGDIYQANLTFRSRFSIVGDAKSLYLDLRTQSKAAHGAYVNDGRRCILSLSPELFFDISADGHVTAKPMKGTAPRSAVLGEDKALAERLRNSPKDRAENLMIVDLLRNDIGRISETGSVRVEDMFSIETYPTVHQMVSTVRARLEPRVSIGEILRGLFPCGSVTGVPKIRAMEIIRELEVSNRGTYCGAIGYFAPDGSASFNVAIRTLTIADGQGELGIGSAIVHDSGAVSEYDECLLKARYFEASRRPIELLETLRFSPDKGFVRLNLHLARMERSAAVFSVPFDAERASIALSACVNGVSTDQRVRLALSERGDFTCTAAPLRSEEVTSWRYGISRSPVSSQDVLLRHKTNWRQVYDIALAKFTGCDEVVFLNEHGRVTEGSRTNVFIRKGGRLVTPGVEEGLLGGCLRQELLDSGFCEEGFVYPEDLCAAEEVFLGNSLRGLIKAYPAAV